MQKHTKIYMQFFDYGMHQDVFVPCECCGSQCVDVHHLDFRQMGGSKDKDYIENLIGLCRMHHDMAHAAEAFNKTLIETHLDFIRDNKPGYEIQTT